MVGGGVGNSARGTLPLVAASVALLLWATGPATAQYSVHHPEMQVNDPDGPDGIPNTADDDNPENGTYKGQDEAWIAMHPFQAGVGFAVYNDFTPVAPDRSVGFGRGDLLTFVPPWTHELVNQIEPVEQWLGAEADAGCAIGGNELFYQCGLEGVTDVYFARSATGSGTSGWEVARFYGGLEAGFFDTPRMSADWSALETRKNRVYVHWQWQVGTGFEIAYTQDPNSGDTWVNGGTTRVYPLSGVYPNIWDLKGAVSDVGPNGEFYVAWIYYFDALWDRASIRFNGTYNPFPNGWPGNRPAFFTERALVPGFDAPEFSATEQRTNVQDTTAWPDIAVDTSACKFNGRIYVVYVEEDDQEDTPNRVKVMVGTPDPNQVTPPTWTGPYVVNWDAPGHSLQWQASVDVDGKGRAGIKWYDTREAGPGQLFRQPYDQYFAYSMNGGVTWSKNIRVTSISSDPDPDIGSGGFRIGEYNGMDAQGDAFFPVWIDLRNWDQNLRDHPPGDVFATRIDVTAWPDFDDDCDVDQESDYEFFQGCYSGPGNPFPPGCGNADFDADGDVDLADYLIFQLYLTGDGNCVCQAAGSEEPFTDDGGQTWYTRADVRERLRLYCQRNGILFR